MNLIFSLLFLFLFIPKGHQFVQESYNDEEDTALDIAGTDGIDLEKLYGPYFQSTESTADGENVKTSPSSIVQTIENGGGSEIGATSAPATAIEGSEENLSAGSSKQNHAQEYDMFSKEGDSAVANLESDDSQNVVDGEESSELSKINKNLAAKSLVQNKMDSSVPKAETVETDPAHDSGLSKRLRIKSKKALQPLEGPDKDVGKKQKKKEEKSTKATIAAKSDPVGDVQENSTVKPPYVMKHKMNKVNDQKEMDDIYFLVITVGCSIAGIAGLALAGYCWYKLHTTAKAVSEAEYAGSYGSTSRKQPTHMMQPGDQKLDYNAEMYHYQHTKNQLAAMEKASGSRVIKGETLEDEEQSDEGDEGDYTVYECPGLAPAGDMTVVNPMFSDQEQVTSDQDANGAHSGRSAEGSPTFPRQKPKE